MITRFEVENYKCLRAVQQPIGPFHILVGPNASGKSTFFDALAFVRDLVATDLREAIALRTNDFFDLVWRRTGADELGGARLTFLVDLRIPDDLRREFLNSTFDSVRYVIRVAVRNLETEPQIRLEELSLGRATDGEPNGLAHAVRMEPSSPLAPNGLDSARLVMRRDLRECRTFGENGALRSPAWTVPNTRSALTLLPDDPEVVALVDWLRDAIESGVQVLHFSGETLRLPSAPTSRAALPWRVRDLKRRAVADYDAWVQHLRTALPNLKSVSAQVRPEDRHCYLVLDYTDGLHVPSWMASDGTLRVLALTSLAYLPGGNGMYLIEEPEDGLHPRNLEVAFDSLKSVYDGQVMVTTHSPLVVALAEPASLLCFSQDAEGATVITPGDRHPMLEDWHGEVDLGTFFAAGVLG